MKANIKKFLGNYPWMSEKEIETQSMMCCRNPTRGEIAFGYGATHYRDFPLEACINKQGKIKKRLFAKDEQLWYSIA